MLFIKSNLQNLYASDSVRRVMHAFWQAFLAVFLLGITGVISSLLSTHDFAAAESAGLALVVAAVCAGFAAVKALYLNQKA